MKTSIIGGIMQLHRWATGRVGMGIVLALGLALSAAWVAVAHANTGVPPALVKDKIEATIFSYNGTDFVRTHTTLFTKEGKSAVNTRLDKDAPAYAALMAKHSYTGEMTLFGHKYEGSYAPLTGQDGGLTGAIWVAVSK